MSWLPILQRELRVRARSRANYWGRFGIGLLGVMLGVPPLAFSGFDPAAVGRGTFTGLVAAAFLLSCAACLVTADSVSAERREGTLRLLFLAGVRDLDVVAGKLASNSLPCLFALVAFLPVLMISILAGGVSGGEVARKGLVLLNTLFLALSAGLWASARGNERFKTARTAVLLVTGLVLVPTLIGRMVAPAGLISPLGGMLQASDAAYQMSAGRYWVSLGLVQAVAWGLLLSSLANLRGGLQIDEVASTTNDRRTLSWAADGSHAAAPLHWLLRRQRGMKAMVWVAALVSLVHYVFYGAFGLSRFWSPGIQVGVHWSLSVAISAVSGALLAWVASRFFVEARRTGELELLLTTPVGARTLVRTQWEVLKRLVRWPVVVMVVPMLLQALVYLMQTRRGVMPAWATYYVISMLLGAVNTVVGVGVLCWLGLWFGLRAANQARAILWTVGFARGVPYLLSIASSIVVTVLLPGLINGIPTVRWLLASLLPQVAALVWFLWLIRLARRQVPRELAGAQPLTFRQALSITLSGDANRFHRIRHWTPQ